MTKQNDKPKPKLSPKGASLRRYFGILAGGSVALVTTAMVKGPRQELLRPPGALPEISFLATCSRCGQCLQSCPYRAIKLGNAEKGASIGTPYIDARKSPCKLCEDLPCIKACPTGALQPLENRFKAKMGLAYINHETCIAWKGLRCEICYRECPAIDKAITIDHFVNPRTKVHAIFGPIIHQEHCTGCGICEHVCIINPTAITVRPRGG